MRYFYFIRYVSEIGGKETHFTNSKPSSAVFPQFEYLVPDVTNRCVGMYQENISLKYMGHVLVSVFIRLPRWLYTLE